MHPVYPSTPRHAKRVWSAESWKHSRSSLSSPARQHSSQPTRKLPAARARTDTSQSYQSQRENSKSTTGVNVGPVRAPGLTISTVANCVLKQALSLRQAPMQAHAAGQSLPVSLRVRLQASNMQVEGCSIPCHHMSTSSPAFPLAYRETLSVGPPAYTRSCPEASES